MAHILPDVEAGDGKDNGIFRGFQEVDEDAQQLVVLLVQALGILAPELGRLVHRRPFQATAAHLCGVLIEGAQVLHRILELLAQVLYVGGNVLVVEATLLRMDSCFSTLHWTMAMQWSLATDESSGFSIRLRKTARIMRVTFSLAQSLRISARMGITLNLFILAASRGLKVSTHRQKINWYCTYE